MRKFLFLLFLLVLGIYLTATAQEGSATRTPVANAKQVNQATRIMHGQATGQLTHAEARALKKEQRHIRRVKRRAKADGVVTVEEKHRINRKQRRANRHIRRQKHDAEVRY